MNILFYKDQENPNFSAFDTFGSLTNHQVFDPGWLGKYPVGTEISKFHAKPEVGTHHNPKDACKHASTLCNMNSNSAKELEEFFNCISMPKSDAMLSSHIDLVFDFT